MKIIQNKKIILAILIFFAVFCLLSPVQIKAEDKKFGPDNTFPTNVPGVPVRVPGDGEVNIENPTITTDGPNIPTDTTTDTKTEKEGLLEQGQKILDSVLAIPDVIGDLLDYGLAMVVAWISWVIFQFLASILSLVGLLFDAIFSVEMFTKAPIVIEGWKIVLGFANMFFAVILVVIAFATMTGNASYGMKNLLGKLIIAAILINFSLIICGAIIDVSQIFVHYFVDEMKNTNKSFAGAIVKGLYIGDLLKSVSIEKINNNESLIGAAAMDRNTNNSNSNLSLSIANAIMGSLFLIMAIFAFAGGIVLLITRMLTLWGLIIFSPLAWIASILPRTQSYYTQWWSDFINKCVVGPAYVFFVYLALRMVKSEVITQIVKDGQASLLSGGNPFEIQVKFILQYITLCGMLFMGFIIAPKLGDHSADIVLNAAKSAQRGATNWAKRQAGSMATGAGRELSKTGAYQGLANWMAGKPLIGRLGTQMQLGAAGLAAKQQKEIDDRGKKFASLSALDQGKAFKSGTWEDKVAILDTLSKDPTKLAAAGLSPQQIKDTLAMAKQRGVLNKETKWANIKHLDASDKTKAFNDATGDEISKFLSGDVAMSDTTLKGLMEAEIIKSGGGKITGQHLIDMSRKNPTAAPGLRTLLENTSGVDDSIKRDIMNNSGKHHLGIGPTKSEIVAREVEKEINNPHTQDEIKQKTDDERQNEIKADIRYTAATTDTNGASLIGHALATAEKKLREDIDLEKAAGGATNVSNYLTAKRATFEAQQGRPATASEIATLRQEAIERGARQDKNEKAHKHKEALRSIMRSDKETNLSRDAANPSLATPGSLAHQYGNAFEWRA